MLRKPRSTIVNWVNRRLRAHGMGDLQSQSREDAEYSYQLAPRRKAYRILDFLLWYLRLRYIPKECGVAECSVTCPTYPEPTSQSEESDERGAASFRERIWHSFFNETNALIRHDDSLNWQKFHYMLFVFGALLTAFVWSFNRSPNGDWLRVFIGVVGCFLSWGADLTFQEGLRCLRAHRRKLAALESKSPPAKQTFLLSREAYNQRDVLEAGPLVMFLLSLAMTAVAVLGLLS